MVEDLITGEKEITDELNGDHTMEESDTEKYLGDLISNDGKNFKNIEARRAKGTGIVDQIVTILENTMFGPFQFEVALILRSSLLLNGILTNSEAWYGLKTADLERLEQVDENLLRKVLEVGVGCPKEMLYLELGAIPIRFIVACRRLMFLHTILKEDPDCLISRFYKAQVKDPLKTDWCNTVENDLKEYEIYQTYKEIKAMSEEKFKSVVKYKIKVKALQFLNELKSKHTKVLHIEHTTLSIQEYLLPPQVVEIQLAKFLFQSRTRMLECKDNFSHKYKLEEMGCPLGCNTKDSQKHLFECDKLITSCVTKNNQPSYEDLFSDNVSSQLEVATILRERLKTRKEQIDQSSN